MLFALVVLGAGIGLRDPWPSDEPRFALAAKQMVDSGDWLFPHRGRELYSDKPPVLFWMQASAYEVVRNWRIAFLLPSLLAGLLTLGLTWDLGRRLWNPRVGWLAAAALLATFQFVYQFKRAQIDPLVVCWITLANWGLLLHFLRGPDWRAYWLGCFAAGVGVITKGVGILALLMFAPYLFARARGWEGIATTTRSAWRWSAGAALFVLPIALWVVPMWLTAHARATPAYTAYVNDILFHQTAGRYAHSWDHAHSFLYYLPIVLFSWFPLSLTYPGTFPRWRRALRQRDARILLPLVWVGLMLVFFCIPGGKRDVYIMPALPMLALVSAPYLDELMQQTWLRRAGFWSIALLGAALVLIGASAWLGMPLLTRFAARDLPDAGSAVWVVATAIGAAMLASAAWFRVRRGVHAAAFGLFGMWLVWSLAGYPVLNAGSSAREVMQRTDAIIGADGELGMVAWKEQNMLMAGRAVVDFGFTRDWSAQFEDAVRWQAEAPAKRWIFVLADAMGDCVDRKRAQFAGRANRRDWWVVPQAAVVPGCVPGSGADDDSDP